MVSLDHIHFAYERRILFSDLSLEIAPGSVCGLLGKNGAGKTTLMKIIAGLRFANAGRLDTLGFQPAHRHPDLLAQVFYLPETIVLPNVSAKSYVAALAPFYPQFDHAHYAELTAEFDLPTQTRLASMSLGESRKMMLAFALAAGCRLLLLDEPANGLDIPSRKQLRKLLALAMRDDRSIVISTHQVHDIEALIDAIAILHNGQIILHETLDALNRRLFIGRQIDAPAPDSALYSERAAGGYAVVKERGAEPETAPDLELLFQAAIADPQRLRAVFQSNQPLLPHA
jgi:ABC-2 type transport system ATP-binding protein